MKKGRCIILRVAVLSDTHNRVSQKVLDICASCDRIIHAGDLCTREVAAQFDKAGMMYMVRGNNDDFIPYGQLRTITFEIEGHHFLVIHNANELHGDDIPESTDIVIYGHTHLYKCTEKEGRIWLNPGSAERPRYFPQKTMSILNVEKDKKIEVEKVVL